MSKDPNQHPDDGLSIGIVSRLTGINPETLRVWERRYNMTTPARAGMRKTRRYSQADVRRLSAVKALVDAGHPVSSVANLSMEQLASRLRESGSAIRLAGAPPASPIRVLVVGESLAPRMREAADQMPEIQIVEAFVDSASFEGRIADLVADVMVLEQASLQPDAIRTLQARVAASAVPHTVVIYGFASQSTLDILRDAGIVCLSQSANPAEIQWACQAAAGAAAQPNVAKTTVKAGIVTARRFSAKQLARIAQSAPSVKCECPRHLVSLVNGLLSFETYSLECANLNAHDREIHHVLYAASVSARVKLESALATLIEFEGLRLD